MKYTRLALFSMILVFTLASIISGVGALPAEDEKAYIYDSVYYDGDATTDRCSQGGAESIEELPSKIRQPYRDLFPEAASEQNADLALLTFVFFWENRDFPPPDYDWPTSDLEGDDDPQGPFQFRPSTWDAYGVDGDGDGDKDLQDVTDAAYGAANFLNSLGGSQGSPVGSAANPFEEGTLAYAMGAYNHGPAAMERKKDLPEDERELPKETRDYIKRGVTFIRDLRSGTVNLSTDVEAGGGETAQANVSLSSNGCGGLGVGSDLVFPLKTTKAAIREGTTLNGTTLTWCHDNQTNCHSPPGSDDLYKAADVFVEPGTEVVAATSGTVIKTDPPGPSLSVRIHGEDGNYYHYQHLKPHSERVNENDRVEAGDVIGVIGGPKAAFGTAPHLHFDVATENVGISRDCVSSGNCEYEKSVMIDAQPDLVGAYKALPQD
ncbi:hypothetical protein BRC19_00680 [Candidatus Saccharibacteria bacterium QS_5_54_17]|nr:MAG: hypothetical protein BRC19_00680 [Candidatus Saccharibacteria bacterium QS_5_54_17]